MKRFKYIVLAMVIAVGSSTVFTSCEDSDKFRFPELGNGGFVKFVFQPDCWDGLFIIEGTSYTIYSMGDDPATASFNALVEDPNGNVASYELFVGREGDKTDALLPFKSTTSFPFDVSFTGQDMATLFNVPIETFEDNSTNGLLFTSTITLTNGTVYNSIVTACDECPDALVDDDGNPLDPGMWNGGTIDGVLLQGGDTGENELLPAVAYVVNFSAQDCL